MSRFSAAVKLDTRVYRSCDRGPAPAARQRGFTLIEVLASMLLLGVSITALLSGISWGINTAAMQRENQIATQILTERMDTIRLYSHSLITNNAYFPKTVTVTNVGSGKQVYTLSMTVTNNFLGVNYRTNLAQVTLTLNWSTYGTPRQRTVRTFVAMNGLQAYVN